MVDYIPVHIFLFSFFSSTVNSSKYSSDIHMIYQRNSTSSKSLIYYELHIFSIANVLVSDLLMRSMNNK